MSKYFEYLCSEVGIGGPDGLPYTRLAEYLMWIDFESKVPGDRNRESDGVMLRQGYSDAPRGRCRVFELLVALCQRVVFMAGGSQSEWFEAMLVNLGISVCDDDLWNQDNDDARDICEYKVRKWIERDIDFDGSGGIFPLSDPHDDQAETEIWYQMNAYLIEKMGDI